MQQVYIWFLEFCLDRNHRIRFLIFLVLHYAVYSSVKYIEGTVCVLKTKGAEICSWIRAYSRHISHKYWAKITSYQSSHFISLLNEISVITCMYHVTMLENKIHQEFSVSSNWAIYSSSNEINGSWKHYYSAGMQHSLQTGPKVTSLTLLPEKFLSLELGLSQYCLECYISEEVNEKWMKNEWKKNDWSSFLHQSFDVSVNIPSPIRTNEDWFLAFPSWICTV